MLGDLEKFPCFLILRKELDDVTYFRLLGEALTSECYAGEFPDFTRTLLTERPISARHHFMDESERAYLEELPSKLTIYRGVHPSAMDGFSWTLSKKKAKNFADGHLNLGNDAGIGCSTCLKKDVIAYFDREEEIFIDLQDVKKTSLIELFIGDRKSKVDLSKYIAYLKIKAHLISIDVLPPLSQKT